MIVTNFIFFGFVAGCIQGTVTSDIFQQSALQSKYGRDLKESFSCGGFLEGPAGIINYKLNQNFSSKGEGCVWTVIVPRKTTIQVKIIDDGFRQDCVKCQMITLLNLSTANGNELEKTDQIYIHPDRSPRNITGSSLIQIVFTSYDPRNATGFRLSFEGIGPDYDIITNKQPRYIVYDPLRSRRGVVNYEASIGKGWDFVIFTLNPEKIASITLEYINDDQWVFDSYKKGCGQSTQQKFIISDFDLPTGTPSTRLRECYPYRETYNTTVTSEVPLQVTFSSSMALKGSFRFSWELQ